ncbi:DUF5819 family protein [Gracilibacillus boraciitolerans]|uniref:DUF5819 family protein n=1 Tax=Gracilibacillus boraciitolerans TaxID=307521 RepID=UPI001F1EA6D6|nr:DUF5819 family protein [Gracilibacillus boraciitolerans]
MKFKPFTDKYVDNFFRQSWHLFAPEPLTNNYTMFVQVKLRNNNTESEWYNITDPLVRANNDSVFTPYNRMLRVGLGYINSYNLGVTDVLTVKIMNKSLEKSDDTSRYDELAEITQSEVEKVLYRYASSYAKKIYDEKDIDKIRILINSTEAVPYSKRNDKEYQPEENFTTLEWKELNNNVVAFP